MELNIDLHSHSGASGGVGEISLRQVFQTMGFKGIDIYGTGDCLYPEWLETLEKNFQEQNGILTSEEYPKKGLVLQTEVIFTMPYPQKPTRRKAWHNVLLFPHFKAAKQTINLLDEFGVKNTIGRPFLTVNNIKELENFLFTLKEINQQIEVIPAHIFTPQGVFGSKNPINSLKDVYGTFTKYINAVETGLSADPKALMMIPELDHLSFISSSDAHCGRLDRLGREYSTLEVKELSYPAIINALKTGSMVQTYEFPMTEGRYFLTGHRERNNHPGWCCFSPQHTPPTRICPLCGKKLTIGVLQRVLDLAQTQKAGNRNWGENYGPRKRKFKKIVPLSEVIANSLNIKTTNSKSVINLYKKTIERTNTEANLWKLTNKNIQRELEDIVPPQTIKSIKEVNKGNFSFSPPGYDGTYGSLQIGKTINFWNIKKIKKDPTQSQQEPLLS
ncbi:MAG: endonuclease Q family protein [Patescibacteria group bacterium]|nr:endonuclease Q family protein [Patescibacteria group bacterium]